MRRSKTEIYLHFVWAARLRELVLQGRIEKLSYEVMAAEAEKLACQILAMDGTEDHVHVLVRVPGIVSAAEFAKQVKGVSSNVVNDHLPDGSSFRWQEGYGCFSVSRSHVRRVRQYVESQKERHALNDLWSEWEEVDEESEAATANQ
jgi:REP element-mobilizing transposase RayT